MSTITFTGLASGRDPFIDPAGMIELGGFDSPYTLIYELSNNETISVTFTLDSIPYSQTFTPAHAWTTTINGLSIRADFGGFLDFADSPSGGHFQTGPCPGIGNPCGIFLTGIVDVPAPVVGTGPLALLILLLALWRRHSC